MREEFIQKYKLKSVIVARPTVAISEVVNTNYSNEQKNKYKFIYPSYPRFFKNFEVVCMACEILEGKGITAYEVFLTIDGNENKYSKDLKKRYGKLRSVNFMGLQERKHLFNLYGAADCMIFPSKLESWGLPISEFKGTGKSMLVADLPYAHETIGTYDKVCFFNPDNSVELAKLMEKEILYCAQYNFVKEKEIKKPYCKDWHELLCVIFSNTESE
ncbi:glycosyltransferase [Clostridium sp. FP2]|nr:glycosyltransferase [Clostridium sp. FP2]